MKEIIRNHTACSCTFVKSVKVKCPKIDVEGDKTFPAQIWKTEGGISYARVFSLPNNDVEYFKIDMSQIQIIDE